MAELKNCVRCDNVFAMNIKDICPKCYRKEEDDFQKVYRYLTNKKNRQATIDEIIETTEVEKHLIITFIKQNRLRSSQFPNLAYPCEKCAIPISEGRICRDCSSEIKLEVDRHNEMDRLTKERNETVTTFFMDNKGEK